MNGQPKKDMERFGAVVQLAVMVLGALSACAGVFLVMGYLIVLSYLTYMGLYGLVEFPGFFYKEALVNFVKDGILFVPELIDFFGDHLIGVIGICVLLAGLWFLLGHLVGRRGAFDGWKKWIYGAGCVIAVLLFVHPEYVAGRNVEILRFLPKLILYCVALPIYVVLCVGLASRRELSPGWKFQVVMFLLLTITIPCMYGARVYDLNCYQVGKAFPSGPDSSLTVLQDLNEKVYFVVGHTSGRDVFIRENGAKLKNDEKLEVVTIDKAQIRGLTITDVRSARTLRELRWGKSAAMPSDTASAAGAGGTSGTYLDQQEVKSLME